MKTKCISLLLCFITVFITACVLDENNISTPFSQYWGAEMEYDDSGATRSLNVAAVCLDIDPLPEVNRSKVVAFIDKIKLEQPNVRLILFPEYILYYYRPSGSAEYIQSIAETIPGETTDVLAEKAKERGIYISFGIPEKSGGDLYNSQVLIDPDGRIASIHHKNFLDPLDKEIGYKAGQEITVNIIDNIKVATILCHDIDSLEVNKKIHKSGAELVLHSLANPFSTVTDLQPHQYTYTWVLSANRVGNENGIDFTGTLSLTAPSGERRIRTTGKEGYIYGVVKCW